MNKKIPPSLIEQLAESRKAQCFPPQTRRLARSIAHLSLGLLFPHFADRLDCDNLTIEEEVERLQTRIHEYQESIAQHINGAPQPDPIHYLGQLPKVHSALLLDAGAILDGDPAARSLDEVILTYPGFLAVAVYRIAHVLYELNAPLLPRMLTEWAHEATGIDIHPGAVIGPRFCIDHGTGIVVGETCHIGEHVKLYQGVTLGALSVEKAMAGSKRHPTIQDGVVIYANATILGGNTVIGARSIIGGNAWVTKSIPPDSLVSRSAEVIPLAEMNSLEYFI